MSASGRHKALTPASSPNDFPLSFLCVFCVSVVKHVGYVSPPPPSPPPWPRCAPCAPPPQSGAGRRPAPFTPRNPDPLAQPGDAPDAQHLMALAQSRLRVGCARSPRLGEQDGCVSVWGGVGQV